MVDPCAHAYSSMKICTLGGIIFWKQPWLGNLTQNLISNQITTHFNNIDYIHWNWTILIIHGDDNLLNISRTGRAQVWKAQCYLITRYLHAPYLYTAMLNVLTLHHSPTDAFNDWSTIPEFMTWMGSWLRINNANFPAPQFTPRPRDMTPPSMYLIDDKVSNIYMPWISPDTYHCSWLSPKCVFQKLLHCFSSPVRLLRLDLMLALCHKMPKDSSMSLWTIWIGHTTKTLAIFMKQADLLHWDTILEVQHGTPSDFWQGTKARMYPKPRR